MSDAALASPAPRIPATVALFALAIFTSATLVFMVQPMITKMILPLMGGSAAVWNTAMVFFQTALLVGYAYAHLLQRVRSLRIQFAIHLTLLVIAALTLPLHVSGALGEPDTTKPILWLLGTLALSIGAPFAILSATAPLMQAWYARVRAGEPDAKNPYVLYAASNLGSFIALLAYPIILEPLLRLHTQTWVWTAGYGLFFILAATLAVTSWGARAGPEPAPLEKTEPTPIRQKVIWVLLAAAPSSLMLGVTQHLTTDVASAPFLWVIPLALYLLTFVIAFSTRPLISFSITLLAHAIFVSICAWIMPFGTAYWAVLFIAHLGAFFFTALLCHQSLAARRPAPDQLTEFFLLLSLGGVLGGAFNALLAPVIFNTVREYPLVLLLAIFARPRSEGKPAMTDWYCFVTAVVLAILPPVMFEAMKHASGAFHQVISWGFIQNASYSMLAVAGIMAFLARNQRAMLIGALTVLTFSAHAVAERYQWVATDRSFFGILRVAEYEDPGLGKVHMLLHGTTLHGAQIQRAPNNCVPMLYYNVNTPIGQSMRKIQETRPGGATVGVVGLGTGAMAPYVRPQDRLTYYEIDPLVVEFARDPAKFSLLNCADGPINIVMGDARLSLEKEPAGKFDLLIIDAFSSDAVPTHLLTVEALRTYLKALKPDGVVVLHLSNRNLEITQPAIAAAAELGVPALHQIYYENENAAPNVEASTEALLVAPSPAGSIVFEVDPRWERPESTKVRAWTDDYTNLMGALWRDLTLRISYFVSSFKSTEQRETEAASG